MAKSIALTGGISKPLSFQKKFQIFFEIEHFFGQKMVKIWQFFPKKWKMTPPTIKHRRVGQLDTIQI